MRLVPFDRSTLRSEDPPERVATSLRAAVSPRRRWLDAPREPFQGTVRDREFTLMFTPGRRRRRPDGPWARPVIEGKIAPAGAGSEVRLRIRPPLVLGGFTALWSVLAVLFLVGGLRIALGWGAAPAGAEPEANGAILLLGGAMLLAGQGVCLAAFRRGARRARFLLCEHLGCREVSPVPRASARLPPHT
ncbi:MAG TPA: hypothetical protein VFP65_09510 [Anaeromyxobacteraceae bacterium]|nr:hypothetical protein [Anaeromyxobacteraceae bacterium]